MNTGLTLRARWSLIHEHANTALVTPKPACWANGNISVRIAVLDILWSPRQLNGWNRTRSMGRMWQGSRLAALAAYRHHTLSLACASILALALAVLVMSIVMYLWLPQHLPMLEALLSLSAVVCVAKQSTPYSDRQLLQQFNANANARRNKGFGSKGGSERHSKRIYSANASPLWTYDWRTLQTKGQLTICTCSRAQHKGRGRLVLCKQNTPELDLFEHTKGMSL